MCQGARCHCGKTGMTSPAANSRARNPVVRSMAMPSEAINRFLQVKVCSGVVSDFVRNSVYSCGSDRRGFDLLNGICFGQIEITEN